MRNAKAIRKGNDEGHHDGKESAAKKLNLGEVIASGRGKLNLGEVIASGRGKEINDMFGFLEKR